VKRTLKKGLKVLEIVKRERNKITLKRELNKGLKLLREKQSKRRGIIRGSRRISE